MKFIVSILLIALLSFLSGLYLPWWGIALAAALVSILIQQKPGIAFLSGFLALLLLWGSMAWGIDGANNGILSKKIAAILPLGGNSFLLVLITGLVAALVGGSAAMTGSYFKKLVRQ